MNSDFCVAVHALVYLDHTGRVTPSGELAENICTASPRVRKVASKLRKAGLIACREGEGGGMTLARPISGVTLADVADALGFEAVEEKWYSGDVDRDCMISSGMGEAMRGVIGGLNSACRAYLSSRTVADVRDEIIRIKEKKAAQTPGK